MLSTGIRGACGGLVGLFVNVALLWGKFSKGPWKVESRPLLCEWDIVEKFQSVFSELQLYCGVYIPAEVSSAS